jgi:hypothetical protein
MKISRNEPCPCGSGKKFKQCHLGKPLPGEEGSDEVLAEEKGEMTKAGIMIGLLGLAVCVAVGFWKDTYTALVVAAAWALGQAAYMSFRNPPPPNDNAGNPAALDFGRSEDNRS